MKEYEQLLGVVQHSWLQAETMDYALQLRPLAFGFIVLRPAIGTEIFKGFQWVDSFLKG